MELLEKNRSGMKEKKKSVFDLVGNTPLLEIKHPYGADITIAAKLEYYNPSGSVKDRAAKNMILSAKNAGKSSSGSSSPGNLS